MAGEACIGEDRWPAIHDSKAGGRGEPVTTEPSAPSRLLRFATRVALRSDCASPAPAPEQFDLFSAAGVGPSAPPPPLPRHVMLEPEQLTDAVLLSAIPEAGLGTCHALAREAAVVGATKRDAVESSQRSPALKPCTTPRIDPA